MSGTLGFSGAYNRTPTLKPISSTYNAVDESSSAHQAHVEREVKGLRAENAKLRKDYDELNTAFKQIIGETAHEKFDERRISLLKMQIIQLEKQVSLLNEALGGRHQSMLEVENTMAWLANKLRSYISADVKGPLVPIARSDLMQLVESSESARIKLFKAVEGSGRDAVGKSLLLLNPFLDGKQKQNEQLTLLDICLNRMDYINFRHVAQLESKLCTLYKEMVRMHEELEHVTQAPTHVGQVSSPEWERMKTTVLKTCMIGKDAADDLLSLSLLCPSAPWPVLKRPLAKDVPVERVTAALPIVTSRQKQDEITNVLEGSIGVCNHRHLLLEKEKAVYKEELNFHRAVHDLQVQYTKSLFEAVRKGYGEFEESARATIVKPIKNMLDAYKDLKGSASEQGLRQFLVAIKDNEDQLMSVVDSLENQDFENDNSGAEAFSKFGTDFFEKLDSLVKQCQTERDKALASRKDVAEGQHLKEQELARLIEELEIKYEREWVPAHKTPDVRVNCLDDAEFSMAQSEATTENNIATDRSSNISSETKSVRDDPTVLRSYLYHSEMKDSEKPLEWNSTSRPGSGQIQEEFAGQLKSLDSANNASHKRKHTKKGTKWKPQREWINDFSTGSTEAIIDHTTEIPDPVPVQTHMKTSGTPHLPALNKNEKTGNRTSDTLTVENENGATSISLKSKSIKPRSYEPNLFVPNRTLKLRRAGSLSGAGRAFLGDVDPEHDKHLTIENADKESDNKSSERQRPSDISKVCKDTVSVQKKMTSQKRSSWR